jgi:hypothetical protein
MKMFKRMRETARDLPAGPGEETEKMTSGTVPSKCTVQRDLAIEKCTVPYAAGKRAMACPAVSWAGIFRGGGRVYE